MGLVDGSRLILAALASRGSIPRRSTITKYIIIYTND
jgi:hypothetical protein